ncbi:hypothetical protein D6817_01545 [Candidatus Pacearchaeota archaeon]|nr:MAG: hypothetical protein D6817_01545 [Candidatus Pacearchaeota archaeon]
MYEVIRPTKIEKAPPEKLEQEIIRVDELSPLPRTKIIELALAWNRSQGYVSEINDRELRGLTLKAVDNEMMLLSRYIPLLDALGRDYEMIYRVELGISNTYQFRTSSRVGNSETERDLFARLNSEQQRSSLYPRCCANAWQQILRGNRSFQQARATLESFARENREIAPYLKHIPCKPNCEQTTISALAVKKIIEQNFKQLPELLKRKLAQEVRLTPSAHNCCEAVR